MKNIYLAAFLLFAQVFVKAQAGAALNFDGNSDRIDLGTLITSNTGYTKEAWVYPTGAGSLNIISSNNAPFWLTGNHLTASNSFATGGYQLQTRLPHRLIQQRR